MAWLIDLQLREHKSYADYDPEIIFAKDGSALKCTSTLASMGRGYIFHNVLRSYLNGKKVSITYETYSTHTEMPFDCKILDGSYDRTSDTDFPAGSEILSKGNGVLNTIYDVTGTNASSNVTTAVLDLSGGTETNVSIVLRIKDGWSVQSGWFKITKFEILDSGNNVLRRAYFGTDESSVDMEQTGTTGDYGILDIYYIKRELSEAFSIVDSKITKIYKALAEAFSAVDSWVARISLAESFSVVDSKVTKITKALSEAFSVADSFVYTVILHFYEALSIKDSFTKYLLSFWHKVTKEIAKFTGVEKEKEDWDKVDREKGDWEKKDEE